MLNIWKAITILPFLAACAATPEGLTRADTAGITSVKVEVCYDSANQQPYPCLIEWQDGKVKEAVVLSFRYGDISFSYSANGVTQPENVMRARAAVHAAMVKAQGEVIPGVVDAVTSAVVRVLVPGSNLPTL